MGRAPELRDNASRASRIAVILDGATSSNVIDRDTSATATQPVACWNEFSSAVRLAGELKANAASAALIKTGETLMIW